MLTYFGPDVYNNFAWLIATRPVPNRLKLFPEALENAEHTVSLEPTANYKDTLACVYALAVKFPDAIRYEREAIVQHDTTEFEQRLKLFTVNRKDCTGQ
jgi:hypothetical protein